MNQKQIRLLWLGAAVSLAAIVALDYRGTTLGIHSFSPLFTCLSLGVYYACRKLCAALAWTTRCFPSCARADGPSPTDCRYSTKNGSSTTASSPMTRS